LQRTIFGTLNVLGLWFITTITNKNEWLLQLHIATISHILQRSDDMALGGFFSSDGTNIEQALASPLA
jgi:hypothetical protein